MEKLCLVALVAASFVGVFSETCGPCDPTSCSYVGCSYGFTKDYCGCCDTCLKGPGELCGGFENNFGTCSEDLECQEFYESSLDNGLCIPFDEEEELSRKKRRIGLNSRRLGKGLIKAKLHRHTQYGNGIPPYILEALRKSRNKSG